MKNRISKILATSSVLFSLNIKAQSNLGFEYSTFKVKNGNEAVINNNLLQKTNFVNGNYRGLIYNLLLNRELRFSAGIGQTRLSTQTETEGVFSVTNQYGVILTNGNFVYWTFPLSVSQNFSIRSKSFTGFKITYVPNILSSEKFHTEKTDGALSNSDEYTICNRSQVFQHSLLLSINHRYAAFNKFLMIDVAPFIGLGSGYFKSDASKINTVSYGINFSLQINLSSINIERRPVRNDPEKKKLLEQKQKEIQEKLNNKK